jgi:PTH2 family peptidyl-tRNA hydrolase
MVIDNSYKMLVFVRKDINMPKGKLAAQVAHACVGVALKEKEKNPLVFKNWFEQGQKKIVLQVPKKEELFKIINKVPNSISYSLIEDAGRTCFKEPTITCLGVGLLKDNDPIFDEYKLL